jgi:hypothetical protein
MGMENWCNDTDSGRTKHFEKDLNQCQFVHHKSRMDGHGNKPGPAR